MANSCDVGSRRHRACEAWTGIFTLKANRDAPVGAIQLND
jgi:hypothetical protein